MTERFQQVPVVLTILTSTDEQPTLEHKETHEAQLYENGDKKVIKYDELVEDGAIRSLIMITQDEVKIIRHGVVQMNQTYKLGDSITGTYRTPYGVFNIETRTHKCLIALQQMEGTIRLAYDLQLNGQHVEQRFVHIHYEVQ